MGKTYRNDKRDINNPVAVAMNKRYSKTTSVMKDRRGPRGGTRNAFRDYLDNMEDDDSVQENDNDYISDEPVAAE